MMVFVRNLHFQFLVKKSRLGNTDLSHFGHGFDFFRLLCVVYHQMDLSQRYSIHLKIEAI